MVVGVDIPSLIGGLVSRVFGSIVTSDIAGGPGNHRD